MINVTKAANHNSSTNKSDLTRVDKYGKLVKCEPMSNEKLFLGYEIAQIMKKMV